MRREDIRISTPEEPTLYAWGTRSLSDPKIFDDPMSWDFRGYRPAFIYDFKDGRVLALVAKDHPAQQSYRAAAQATPEEAIQYTLADYQERIEKLAPFSRSFGLTKDQVEERQAIFDTLKVRPQGWDIVWATAANVKMLWVDYDEQLNTHIAEGAAARLAEANAEKERQERAEAVKDRLEGYADFLGYTLEQVSDRGYAKTDNFIVYDRHRNRVEVPLELVEVFLTRLHELGF